MNLSSSNVYIINMKDEYITKLFFGKRQFIITNYKKYLIKDSKYFNYNLFEYLNNKYDDSKSIKETLYRIKYQINKRPVCKKCGNEVNFIAGKEIFESFCCKSCANSYNHKIANNTKLNKYGSVNNINKMKSTCMKKYGVDNPWKSEKIKEKLRKTWIRKYGVDNYAKFSHNIYTFTEEAKQKRIETKRKNHTFNTSKPEEELYLYIKEKFPLVKRQYKDKERYPYNCDFYIPELDYFIELQGYYTHGRHPYDPNSIKDQTLVERYKERYGPNCQAITIWTIKDVEKRECAKIHNLNFKEVWTLQEGKEFIDKLYLQYGKRF